MKNYIFLFLAIVFEAIATSMLKTSEQFTKLLPSIITIVCYAGAFYFLSLTLKTIPVGIAYAIWSAVGIVLITLVGMLAFKQIPDLPAIIGLLFIIAGVVIINIFSKTAGR
ncbi:DMT family transporter [Niabella drilacis]|uniref:Small multidrug resistance pump n=1 Tax=Niabella drilacis (strain DSM 25811 / CCM 8410 / CCUG 62505 / LMG 26954 / E90) TaxID=1285928 RepID=A0A1G6KTW8_NIADE|nr:SMR family transporter [Niabella drilacis]SDC34520.1 small multidrug resistance pump [Niabella drilacis]